MASTHYHMSSTADSSATRRNSTASEKTLVYSAYNFSTDKAKDYSTTTGLDDDSKTLYDHQYSSHKTKMARVVTKVKSKLSPSSSSSSTTSSTTTRRPPVPADYYPNNLRTFEALSASRM